MINKAKEIKVVLTPEEKEENKPVDVVDLDIQCHILIKDVDTDEIILNKRG